MGSHYRVVPVRGFAHGSPAVIESSTPMGSPASRCGIGWWELSRRIGYLPRRDAIHRVSPARGIAPPRHSSPRWPIRSVRDAMNRVSTQADILPRAATVPKPDCERRVGAAAGRRHGRFSPDPRDVSTIPRDVSVDPWGVSAIPWGVSDGPMACLVRRMRMFFAQIAIPAAQNARERRPRSVPSRGIGGVKTVPSALFGPRGLVAIFWKNGANERRVFAKS